MFSRKSSIWFAGYLAVAALVFSFGCKSEKTEPECVEPPAQAGEGKKVTQTRLKVKEPDPEKINKDWCRTCVMGPRGWASCQVVFAEKDDETRESIKKRAREKACLDAGFAAGTCPEKAVVAMSCKGDQPADAKGDPANALQQAFFGKQAAKKDSPEGAKAQNSPQSGKDK